MALRLKVATILFTLLICYSCSNDDSTIETNQDVVLVFGWFADGLCSGDCTSIYKLEDGNVYRDIDYNDLSGDSFQGNFQEMSNTSFQDYVGLINQLPSSIFSEPNGYLGCSDCTDDLGGLYVEYKTNNETQTWRIRNGQSPEYISSYRSLLIDKLAELNSL